MASSPSSLFDVRCHGITDADCVLSGIDFPVKWKKEIEFLSVSLQPWSRCVLIEVTKRSLLLLPLFLPSFLGKAGFFALSSLSRVRPPLTLKALIKLSVCQPRDCHQFHYTRWHWPLSPFADVFRGTTLLQIRCTKRGNNHYRQQKGWTHTSATLSSRRPPAHAPAISRHHKWPRGLCNCSVYNNNCYNGPSISSTLPSFPKRNGPSTTTTTTSLAASASGSTLYGSIDRRRGEDERREGGRFLFEERENVCRERGGSCHILPLLGLRFLFLFTLLLLLFFFPQCLSLPPSLPDIGTRGWSGLIGVGLCDLTNRNISRGRRKQQQTWFGTVPKIRP